MLIPAKISEVSELVGTEGTQVSDVVRIGAVMFAFVLGSLIMSVVASYTIAKISAVFSESMRNDIFRKTMEFSVGEVGTISSSSLITRCTGDVFLLQMFVVTGLQVLVKAPVTAVWGIQKLSSAGTALMVAMIIAVAIIVIYMTIVILTTTPMSVRLQEITDNINRETKEHISGIQVIRAFLAETFHQKRFRDANDEMTDLNIRLNRIMAFLSPGLILVLNMLNLSMVVIGAMIVDAAPTEERAKRPFSDIVIFILCSNDYLSIHYTCQCVYAPSSCNHLP